jgi:hypothetical protein
MSDSLKKTNSAGWNDPPSEKFKLQPTNLLNNSYDYKSVSVNLSTLIAGLATKINGNNDIKTLDDAQKRISPLLDHLNNGENGDNLIIIVPSIIKFIDGIKDKQYPVCSKIINEWMTTIYSSDSSSNQWIIGLKRVLELSKNQENKS